MAIRGAVEGERITGGVRHGSVALALIVCAQFLIILDSSIVTVALPAIQRSLGFSQVGVQGVVTSYNTAFAGALILGGRVADLFGRRAVFRWGMVAFAVSSLLCGLAYDPVTLVAARTLQGFSAAVIAPSALALLTTTFPEGPARNKAMTTFGIATVLGFVGGLVFSGPLVEGVGWPAVFLVAVPVGAVVAALTPRFVAAVPPRGGRVDVLGAVLITAGMALVVVAPGEGASGGWTSPGFWLPLLGGLLLLGVFAWVESRVAEPLVRLGFFRRRTLCAANLVTLVAGAMTGAGYLMLTMYLQQVLRYSPLEAGLAVAPTGVVNVLLSRVIGRLVNRFGVRTIMTAATVGAAACLAGLALVITPHQGYAEIALVAVPMGMFFLLTTVTATIGATAGVADHEQGLAGGLRQTSLQLGIALGVATLLSVAASRTHALQAVGTGRTAALISGFQLSYLVLTGLAALAALAAFLGFRTTKRGSQSGGA